MIRRLVRVERFADARTKRLLKEKRVSPMDASRALEAAQYDGEKAHQLVLRLAVMTGSEKKRLSDFARHHPRARVDEMVAEAKEPKLERKLLIDLTDDLKNALDRATKVLNKEREEVAAQAIQEWLHDKGFWK